MTTRANTAPVALEELRVKSERQLVQSVLTAILIPTAIFAFIDLERISPADTNFESLLLARAWSLAVPLAGLWLIRGVDTRQALSRSVFTLALGALPMLMVLVLQEPRGAVLELSPMLLVLVILYGATPNTLARQVAPPLLLSAFLAGIRVWWLDGQSDSGLASDLVVLLSVNVIGVIMVRLRVASQNRVSESWRMEAEASERERAAVERALLSAQELKALRGIIPICAHCKQVRTEAGEWQQIERYVHEHSDANFSHGVCPSCAQRLYSEFLPLVPAGGEAGEEK